MTLADDFYKQMEPSIKKFLDNNIIIADQEEAIRVYKSVKYYKKLHRLPPPDVLEWFQQIYTTEEMITLIKQSYHLKQKKTDEDDKIYEKWMFKNYGDVKLVKKVKRMNALAKAWEMDL
ncbi:hypothetical protein ABNG39_11435 [Streptococcus dysgalactiae]|uniref:hypothetical protein n=1 Tax=Streptococcus dysgalactiae TaxID=1334 RepID=UPI00232FF437|nr:hypothetical protein [Streptococcus dysgalactiae]WCE85967.1 hypothetical protein PMN45_11745 [Streptococcus dysgalactiae]WCN25963.1 hypothetical protein PP188_11745 [Streptococcus dysgalactiae]